jgi:hypothetical protein
MKLQTESKKAISETGLQVKYEFYHPITCRRCFAWFPVSQVTELKFNEIVIPNWLWDKIEKTL